MDAPLNGVGDPRLDAFGEVPDALGEWAGYGRQDFGQEKVHDLLVAKAVGAGDVITHTLRFKHVPHLGLLQVPKLRQNGLDSAIRCVFSRIGKSLWVTLLVVRFPDNRVLSLQIFFDISRYHASGTFHAKTKEECR